MTQMFSRNSSDNPGAVCECGDCGQRWSIDELAIITDVEERVTAGEIMPAGECPDDECGALCYYVTPPEHTAEGQLAMIEQAIRDFHHALDQREDGHVACHQAMDRIQKILNQPWLRGEEMKRRRRNADAAAAGGAGLPHVGGAT